MWQIDGAVTAAAGSDPLQHYGQQRLPAGVGFDCFVAGTAPAFRARAGCAPPNTGISAVINPYSRAVRALGFILW